MFLYSTLPSPHCSSGGEKCGLVAADITTGRIARPVVISLVTNGLFLDEQCPHHLIVLVIEKVAMTDITRTTGIAEAVLFHIQTRARVKRKQVATGPGHTG